MATQITMAKRVGGSDEVTSSPWERPEQRAKSKRVRRKSISDKTADEALSGHVVARWMEVANKRSFWIICTRR